MNFILAYIWIYKYYVYSIQILLFVLLQFGCNSYLKFQNDPK